MTRILCTLLNECFPEKVLTVKDSDDPWITMEIRRLIKRRNREYKKHGKTPKWYRLKKIIAEKIDISKNNFLEKGKENAKKKRDSSGYYKVVNCLKDGEAPKSFNIRSLQPDMSAFELANDVAEYFNAITNKYVPLEEKNANQPDEGSDTPQVMHHEVASRLKGFKKPKSMISGDIFPDLITKFSDIIAIPMTDLINCALMTKKWPEMWKEETMIIIPKCPAPQSYADLRNLSCTPLLSKVLESFVIDKLKEEIKEDLDQYGSTKGCGTDHYLIQAWNHILESMDDGSSCCNLISIDFSKAFNSLDHSKCLEMFSRRGASKHSLEMLHAFLESRKMRVRIDYEMSLPLSINGGSPQGTLLGNIIFIVATSEIDKDIFYDSMYSDGSETSDQNCTPSPVPPTPSPTNPEEIPSSDCSDESPIRFFRESRRNVLLESSDESDADNSILEHNLIRKEIIPSTWDSGKPLVVKYVDDVLGAEKLYNDAGKLHTTAEKQTSSIYAKRSEELINAITTSAAELGLRVNAKKTQMVCISGQISTENTTFIREADTGQKVLSSENMKILGFNFSNKPTVDLHIESTIKKVKKRLWLLRNLKNARATKKDLTDCYTCFVRPVLDFCSNVYHPMISKHHSDLLEKTQASALKIIYGYDKSRSELVEVSGLTTLAERREKLFDSFCQKTYSSERFRKQWLEDRIFEGPNIRRQRIIKEKNAKTTRLFRSPLYTIRRRTNDLNVV